MTIVQDLQNVMKELAAAIADRDKLSAVAEALKADLLAEKEKSAAESKAHEIAVAEATDRIAQLDAARLVAEKSLAEITAELEKSKKLLALSPYQDVSDGQANPHVQSGDAGGENAEKTLYEQMLEIEGGTAQGVFYRKHRAEIDAEIREGRCWSK